MRLLTRLKPLLLPRLRPATRRMLLSPRRLPLLRLLSLLTPQIRVRFGRLRPQLPLLLLPLMRTQS
jgi:hypothetical protein